MCDFFTHDWNYFCRLKGPRGLLALQSSFKDVKYKGKGHEKEDLDTVMTLLEQWTHRLFPKFTFDDTLDRLEQLGHKKIVSVSNDWSVHDNKVHNISNFEFSSPCLSDFVLFIQALRFIDSVLSHILVQRTLFILDRWLIRLIKSVPHFSSVNGFHVS